MLTLSVLLSALTAPAVPFQEPASAIETRVQTAALFKNGLAFVRREATVDAGETSVRLDELPVPAHGTFWIATDPERLELLSAVARRSEVIDTREAVSIEDLLSANVGREVSLDVGTGAALIGRLVAMPVSQARPVERSSYGYLGSPSQPLGLLVLETRQGSVALRSWDVRSVHSKEPLKREVEVKREAVSLALALAPHESEAPLSIQYLARGLTWVPSYAIDVSDAAEAVLTAKAQVINEVEDLEGATLQLVTGFPNLQFAHVADPIAMQGDLDAFLRALGSDPAASPMVAQQAVFSNVAAGGAAAFPIAGAPTEGAAVEDLFLYEQPDVTLKRGERGLYPLFSLRVAYEHLYEWRIGDTVDEQRDEAEQEEVWHSVRLHNDSGTPWTTAPAMTMKDGNLLGQDTLTYAAVGAKTTVRITRAVDVQGQATEYEVARERDAAEFHGRSYDLVTVRGELQATNHKGSPIQLEVTKQLQGEVIENPNGAEVVAVAEGLRKLNPSKRLTWSVALEAGATAEIGYQYTLLVRP